MAGLPEFANRLLPEKPPRAEETQVPVVEKPLGELLSMICEVAAAPSATSPASAMAGSFV